MTCSYICLWFSTIRKTNNHFKTPLGIEKILVSQRCLTSGINVNFCGKILKAYIKYCLNIAILPANDINIPFVHLLWIKEDFQCLEHSRLPGIIFADECSQGIKANYTRITIATEIFNPKRLNLHNYTPFSIPLSDTEGDRPDQDTTTDLGHEIF